MSSLLEVENAVKRFKVKVSSFESRHVHALNEVSLAIGKGDTLSLVGESGCGKTTLGKGIVGLYRIDGGRILFRGQDIAHLRPAQRRPIQKDIQMIFQDPYSSLNPRKKVKSILEQPLKIFHHMNRGERMDWIEEVCANVGIDLSYLQRFPHQFSGGQRQRIAIARAIILKPALVVADEPVSALDVSIQAQILNLLMDLQEKYDLTYLFITHDISVVKHISDFVAVMYLGQIVEHAARLSLFSDPLHPYTRMLLAAVPDINHPELPRAALNTGEVPSPIDLPPGCFFAGRCRDAEPRCRSQRPALVEVRPGHWVRCLRAERPIAHK